MGINLIRREVFGLEDDIKDGSSYHLSTDWQEILLDEEQESFASMMAEVLSLSSGEEFVAKFMAYGEEEEEPEQEEAEAAAVDPEMTEDEERPADDDGACEEEKEEKSVPKKGKGQKRRASPASSKKKKKAAVEKPLPVVGGKSPRNPVRAAVAAAALESADEDAEDAEEEDLEAAVAQTQENIAAAAVSAPLPLRNLRSRRDPDAIDMADD